MPSLPATDSTALAVWRDRTQLATHADRRSRHVGLAVAVVVGTIAAVIAGLPVVAGAIGFGGVTGVVALAWAAAFDASARRAALGPAGPPLVPVALPDDVSDEIADAYRAVLDAHDQLRAAIDRSPQLYPVVAETFARAGELAATAARIARSSAPISAYLRIHRADAISTEIARLEQRAEAAADAEAISGWALAAAARRRQLDSFVRIQRGYDRMRGQLASIHAWIGAAVAAVVAMAAADAETPARLPAGLDDFRDELELAESAARELAAA